MSFNILNDISTKTKQAPSFYSVWSYLLYGKLWIVKQNQYLKVEKDKLNLEKYGKKWYY